MLATVLTTPLLSGCFSDERTIYAICEDNPQICRDIETKGWCKTERAHVIRHREQILTEKNNDHNLYTGLKHWKELSQCIEIAANIKRRKVTDRDAVKEKTFLVTLQEIERIEQASKTSSLPQFLYYHWAQDGDESRITELVALDKRGKLDSTDMQLMMAAYYGKTDNNKAVIAQYNALKLLTQSDLETLPPSLFAGLSTRFYQLRRYKLSFVWAQVAVKAGLKESKFSSLQRHLEGQRANIKMLNNLAQETYDSIQSLKFSEPDSKV